jgi:peptidoglycan/LPS O-acetylase OafA/YrhL
VTAETETPAAAPTSERLAFLDGWRAIAVFVVILSHVSGFRAEPLWLHRDIARWLPVGQIGVLIFFFISGFVISRSALQEIGATGNFAVPAFYTRRAFRIIPPLALYLIACLVLGAFGIVDFHLNNAIPAFPYVCNVEPFNQCIWLGGHTWSLAYEEQFYLLFPALLTLFLLRRMPVLPHLVAASAFCLLPLLFPLSYAGKWDFYLVYGLFGAGFLAARYFTTLDALARRFALPGFLLATALVLAAPIALPWPVVYNNYPLVFLVSIPVMLLCSGHCGIARVLGSRPLVYLGRISYGIYLWQELATSDLTRHQPLLVELGAVVAVVLWCAVLFEVMERPLIRLGRRLAERHAVAAAAGGAPRGSC